MAAVTNPPIDVPAIDPATGRFTKDWYDRLQYLNSLQPLSSIVFPGPDATKSDVLRTINSQTGTTYTFALTDSGNICGFSNTSAITATVPPHSSVAFSVGTQIDLVADNTGKVTIAAGSGVTINSLGGNKSLAGQYAGGTLVNRATDVWDLVGSLIA